MRTLPGWVEGDPKPLSSRGAISLDDPTLKPITDRRISGRPPLKSIPDPNFPADPEPKRTLERAVEAIAELGELDRPCKGCGRALRGGFDSERYLVFHQRGDGKPATGGLYCPDCYQSNHQPTDTLEDRVWQLMCDRIPQTEIGSRLGISQSKVSRLLQSIRKQHDHCPIPPPDGNSVHLVESGRVN